MILKDKIKSLKKSLAKKILDKHIKFGKVLDIRKTESILFFRNDDKIGDTVVSTLLFREIKKKYPNVEIVVLCGKNSKEIIKYNANVDKIYEVKNNFLEDILIFNRLRKKNVSLAIDFYSFRPSFKHLLMLRIIAPKFLIGFCKEAYNIYDFSINADLFNIHISRRYEYLLKILKVENPDLKYDVVFTHKEEDEVIGLLKKYNEKYKIVLNPFAASKHRSFDYSKLKSLINLLEDKIACCVFVLCQKRNMKGIKSLENSKTAVICFESVLESAALIKYSDAVITPDTSIVHIASAFKKKTVALYLDYSNTYEKINIIWGANNPNAVELSVDTKNGVFENSIKNVPNDSIVNTLQELLEKALK